MIFRKRRKEPMETTLKNERVKAKRALKHYQSGNREKLGGDQKTLKRIVKCNM